MHQKRLTNPKLTFSSITFDWRDKHNLNSFAKNINRMNHKSNLVTVKNSKRMDQIRAHMNFLANLYWERWKDNPYFRVYYWIQKHKVLKLSSSITVRSFNRMVLWHILSEGKIALELYTNASLKWDSQSANGAVIFQKDSF